MKSRTRQPAPSVFIRVHPWFHLHGSVVIALAAATVYSNTFRVPLIFDDIPSIRDNTTIRTLWPPWTALFPSTNTDSTTAGRPIANVSLAINYAISGLDVWSYHAINIVIHALAGVLLMLVTRRALSAGSMDVTFQRNAGWIALIIALVWTLHPIQTESVTYIIQRVESLAALFTLVTLYFAQRSMAVKASQWWTAAAIVSCGLGMATKETCAAIPLIVLLYDRAFVSGTIRQSLFSRPMLHGGLALTWLILAALLITSPRTRLLAEGSMHVSRMEYAAIQVSAIPHYLKLLVWPIPLIFDYGLPRHGVAIPQSLGEVWIPMSILLTLLVAGAWMLVRRPAVGFVAAGIVLILAPSTSIVPIGAEPIAEHRMYLPSAGLIAMVIVGVFMVNRLHRQSFMTSAALVACAFAFALGWMTHQRNADYETEISIWKDTKDKRPDNPRAWYNLGQALGVTGDTHQEIAAYNRALELHQDYVRARAGLAAALVNLNRPTEALPHFAAVVELDPNHFRSRFNYGVALAQLGLFDRAAEQFAAAIRINPDDIDAHTSLGMVLIDLGRPTDAATEYREAIRLATAQNDLARGAVAERRLKALGTSAP